MKAKRIGVCLLSAMLAFSGVSLLQPQTVEARVTPESTVKGATDILWKVDEVIERTDLGRVYTGTVTKTTSYIFSPTVTYMGAKIGGGSISYSESCQFRRYTVSTYYKIRFRKEYVDGTFVGYETTSTTISHTEYEAI